ncbi:hypothetical protein [Paraflavitalea sp. CAU 1676]|uniref:hypothetical protein n=1 Tax=Paraflavitalea sp. CAU 1676 TaxID=3032598 RepID=UPI0023DC8280|nr:hypothetical protein [Paraflavitalea sp. CAU 1676]MDF2189309.1 hypothetical protein [Paraflavitalea sp. CAU 1676]
MSTSLNSRSRAEGWRPNYNNRGSNGKRPYEGRQKTSFKRPPAKYSNPSWEDTVSKYVPNDKQSPKKK